ncbi:MAG TPA: pentapeptide repeat-containing protein, partial [Alphaproteobacteria bacterium]|nr:pentapeptide repeat-containing protein [Alphaproteobacteria bacterium]
MTPQQIIEALISHDKWVRHMPGGQRANLSLMDLCGMSLTGARLARIKLTGADLTRSTLDGANLSDADLFAANLSKCDLTGANMSGADIRGACLRDADLAGACLAGADLRNGNLMTHSPERRQLEMLIRETGAMDLNHVNLRGARLSGKALAHSSIL